MKSSRLIRMLLLLQLHGQMSAARLAEELEVSVRTVYRDAEALMMAGVPLYSTSGPAGGYHLVEGWQMCIRDSKQAARPDWWHNHLQSS